MWPQKCKDERIDLLPKSVNFVGLKEILLRARVPSGNASFDKTNKSSETPKTPRVSCSYCPKTYSTHVKKYHQKESDR